MLWLLETKHLEKRYISWTAVIGKMVNNKKIIFVQLSFRDKWREHVNNKRNIGDTQPLWKLTFYILYGER